MNHFNDLLRDCGNHVLGNLLYPQPDIDTFDSFALGRAIHVMKSLKPEHRDPHNKATLVQLRQ